MAVLPPDPVFCFKSDMGYIHSLCFCAKSYNYCPQLLAATEKGTVYFWDLETNRLQHQQHMGESIQKIHYFNDNIITQQKSGLVKLWSVENRAYEIVNTYEAGGGYCKSLILKDNLYVPQEDGAVDVLDVNSLKKVKQLTHDKEKTGWDYVSAGGQSQWECLFIRRLRDRYGDIILWDLNTFKPCGHIKLQEHITSLTFDPVTCRGVCGSASNTLQLFTIDKSYNMTLKCEVSITNEGCNIVKLRPDGKIMVSGGWDGDYGSFPGRP
ncbi:hypothetical protein NQ318_002315 [Aromia moschata]|uniref:Uncharacterized protein n=1 Tax=Aromia moschata TaxID=1265417 RepID=A0AAV8Z5S8_9CUCU|nr:hypothetical protein NQ318_002315 [Aromia moschata]